MLNHKGNAEDHMIQLKRKTEAAYQTILTVLGNQYFNKIELETAWKLLESCIQSILTYGGIPRKETKNQPNTCTREHNSKNNHGPTINTYRSTLHEDRAARHNYNHYKKQIQHGKKTA